MWQAHSTLVGLACAVAWAGLPAQQPAGAMQTSGAAPPAATAAVSGTVVDGSTGAAVAGAIVALLVDGDEHKDSFNRRALTDDKGRFVFDGLAPNDRFTIGASKPGYLDGGFGDGPGASGGPVALREGEWRRDVRVKIWRPASVSGRVLDERGEPEVDVFVRVIRKVHLLGHDQLVAGTVTTTDDRGQYRLANLPPGDYLVQVPSVARAETPRPPMRPATVLTPDGQTPIVPDRFPLPPPPIDSRSLAYPPTFYPGTREIDQASVLSLGFADERAEIDLSLAPVPAFRVGGALEGPEDAWTGLTIRLLPRGGEGLGVGSEIATSEVGAGGRFTFLNVPAGTYTLDATGTVTQLIVPFGFTDPRLSNKGSVSEDLDVGPAGLQIQSTFASDAPGRYVRQPIVIDHDEASLVVPTRPTGTISGRIVEEIVPGVPTLGLAPSVTIQMNPADGSPALGVLRSRTPMTSTSDEFRIDGLLPGKYVLRTMAAFPKGWLVKSVTWNGRDYADTPFDAAQTQDFTGVQVVVTNGGATLSGFVRGETGAPLADATVVVFPADSSLWPNVGLFPRRIRSAVTPANGRYEIDRLPAGRYCMVAVAGTVRLDLEFLGAHEAAATKTALEWSRTTTIDLVVRRSEH